MAMTSKSTAYISYLLKMRWVLIVVCILAVLFVSIVRAGSAAMAAVSVRTDPTQYLIASWRPVREDLGLASRLEGVSAVRYARGESEFVQVLLSGVGMSEAEAKARGLVVFAGKACMIDQLASGSDPLQAALARADLERRASGPNKIPLAVLGGLLAGVWLRFGIQALRFAALGAMATALYQWLTACPTCPSVTVLGVPGGLLGLIVFGALAVGLGLRSSAPVAIWIAAPLSASVLVWQSFMALATGSDCTPCAVIAFMNAAVAMSAIAHGWRTQPAVTGLGGRRLAVALALALAASIGASQFASRDRAGAPHASPPPSLAGYRIQDLGLEPNGRARLLLVAMSQCRLCHDALDFLGRHPDVEVEVFFTDAVPGAYRAFAKPLPDPHWIASTPTFLVVAPDGTVAREEKGWTLGEEWSQKFLDKLEAARRRLEEENPR